MITRTFICEEHEEFGGLGWRPENIPNADPLSGMTVAHDCMEHFKSDNGGLEAELMAFGASLHVREAGGWYYNQPNSQGAAYNMSGEIAEFMLKIKLGEEYLMTAPRTYALSDGMEDTVQEVILMAKKSFREEYEDEEELNSRTIKTFIDWLRIGYRKAIKRYGDASPYSLSYIFSQIADEADKHLKYAEGFGEKLIVSFCPRSEKVSVRIIEDYE